MFMNTVRGYYSLHPVGESMGFGANNSFPVLFSFKILIALHLLNAFYDACFWLLYSNV